MTIYDIVNSDVPLLRRIWGNMFRVSAVGAQVWTEPDPFGRRDAARWGLFQKRLVMLRR